MDSIERLNPSSTKQGSANPVGAYTELVLQIKFKWAPFYAWIELNAHHSLLSMVLNPTDLVEWWGFFPIMANSKKGTNPISMFFEFD